MRLTEFRSANIALKIFEAGMCFVMNPQIRFTIEAFIAHLAHVWFNIGVGNCVTPQFVHWFKT